MCFRADLGDVVKIPEPKSIFDFEPEQGGTTKEERVQVRVFFIWGTNRHVQVLSIIKVQIVVDVLIVVACRTFYISLNPLHAMITWACFQHSFD